MHVVEGLGLQTQDQFNQWAFASVQYIQIFVNFEIFLPEFHSIAWSHFLLSVTEGIIMTQSNRMKFRLEIFKLSWNISLSINKGLKSPFYSWQAIWALKCIRERFNNSLKISKFTRICMENHSSMTGWQEFFPRVVSLLLSFGSCCNRFFWDIWFKFYRLSNFNTSVSVPTWQNFPPYKWTIFVFKKSWSCAQKAYSIKLSGLLIFARSRRRKTQVNPQNPPKFTKTRKISWNSVEILSDTCTTYL